MKVDFRKIVVIDINGQPKEADVSRDLGITLYMQGRDKEESELGRAIYHIGEIEVSERSANIIKRYANSFSYVLRKAVFEALGDVESSNN